MRRDVTILNSRFFFFSRRRRHTRLQGDWSSDVCSSDLDPNGRLSQNEKAVATPDEVTSSFVSQFHREMMGLARESRSEERRVGKESRARQAQEQRNEKSENNERDMKKGHKKDTQKSIEE